MEPLGNERELLVKGVGDDSQDGVEHIGQYYAGAAHQVSAHDTCHEVPDILLQRGGRKCELEDTALLGAEVVEGASGKDGGEDGCCCHEHDEGDGGIGGVAHAATHLHLVHTPAADEAHQGEAHEGEDGHEAHVAVVGLVDGAVIAGIVHEALHIEILHFLFFFVVQR